jgi:hypothetical protein
MEVRRMGTRALEHRQLPLRTALVEAQNVQIAVIAFDLEVAIVWSIPLIDNFDDFDLAPTEPKATGVSTPRWPAQRSTCTFMAALFLVGLGPNGA